MQFFYQFPQRVERLALISSGGLGHEVSPMLRGAALPGAAARDLAGRQPARAARRSSSAGERMRARGSRKGVYLQAIARALRPLQEAAARRAFLQTLRSVIDVRGQHVSAMRPPLPARRAAHPDRLGRARQHDPDGARPAPPTS